MTEPPRPGDPLTLCLAAPRVNKPRAENEPDAGWRSAREVRRWVRFDQLSLTSSTWKVRSELAGMLPRTELP
jgi:hypothetical protein